MRYWQEPTAARNPIATVSDPAAKNVHPA